MSMANNTVVEMKLFLDSASAQTFFPEAWSRQSKALSD